MNLKTQIAATHRIKQIKTNGELSTKPSNYLISKKIHRLKQYQIDRRSLKSHPVDFKHQTILFRNTIKAPGKILLMAIQITHLLHPLPSPWPWIKIGHHTERPPG